jgi:hypothetical protein
MLGMAPGLVHGISLWAKLGTAVAIGALGAGGALYVHGHAPMDQRGPAAPRAALAARVTPAKGLPSEPAAESAPAAQPAPAVVDMSVSVAATTAHAAPARPASARVDEATLLEHARSELASNPAHALQLTAEHAKNYPGGILAQEREVIAIAALRRLGRTAEAEQRAAVFDRTYPNSAHQRSVAADSANTEAAK